MDERGKCVPGAASYTRLGALSLWSYNNDGSSPEQFLCSGLEFCGAILLGVRGQSLGEYGGTRCSQVKPITRRDYTTTEKGRYGAGIAIVTFRFLPSDPRFF